MSTNDNFLTTYALNVDDKPGAHKELEINVRYSEGGMNYFSGSVSPRGFKLSIWPVTRDTSPTGMGSITRTLMDNSGRAFLIKTVKRRNAKVGEAAARLVQARLDEIIVAARKQDWLKINDVCHQIGDQL
jgi:hypothetical protein